MKRSVKNHDGGGTAGSLAEIAYRQIRADIVRGVLEPGRPLRFSEIQGQYRVGVSPIREALSRLVSQRLVVATSQRGFRVAPFSAPEIWDVTRVRQRLEMMALRDSIATGDIEWEAGIVMAFHRLSRVLRPEVTSDTDDEWERNHRAFHLVLISACGSPWLINFAELLADQSERYRRVRRAVEGFSQVRPQLEQEHRDIMQAVLARDAEEATALLNAHYERTAIFLAGQAPAQPSSRPYEIIA